MKMFQLKLTTTPDELLAAFDIIKCVKATSASFFYS